MLLYLIILILGVQLFLSWRNSRRDFDYQVSLYENQKIIIGNQHAVADALILIMKLMNGIGASQAANQANHAAITKLPDIEDLPN